MKILAPTAALLLTSTAALAQLAPQDVLDSWRGFYGGFGATIRTAAPNVTGTTTRFRNVFTQINMAGAETTYSFDWIDMQSNPDGSLDITFSPSGYSTTLSEVSGETFESRASYDISRLSIHAEGVPEDIRYTYTASIITAHQSQSLPEADISITLALENLNGSARSLQPGGDILTDSGSLNLDSLTAKIVSKAQNVPTYLDYRAEDLTIRYDASLPQKPIPEEAQMLGFFPEGMLFGFTMTTGAATTLLDQQTPHGQGVLTFTQSGGALSAAFAESTLRYSISATEAALGLANTPAQPVDFTSTFERFNFGVTFPILKSESPSPFALSLALEGFTVGEEIWAKFDPENALSQAPASFAFSINGTLNLFADLLDQTAFTAVRGAPFELRSLSLESFNLDFEGMGLIGTGDLSFDNARKDPATGLPEPTGALEFSVTGALGMLDKIGRLGLMEPMVILGAKGALGMFATAGSAPDSFTSRIEFTEGGNISVNGQQVR